MCRLLGYATSGFNLSLNDVLGMHEVTDFRDLSEIHNDGWGVALLSNTGFVGFWGRVGNILPRCFYRGFKRGFKLKLLLVNSLL